MPGHTILLPISRRPAAFAAGDVGEGKKGDEMSIHEQKTIGLIIIFIAYVFGMFVMRKLVPEDFRAPIFATILMLGWFIFWASDL